MATDLGISLDSVCFIIVKAREFDAQEQVVEPNPASDPIDDGFRSVLEGHADDSTYDELKTYIEDLDIDEQCALVALTWLGRGDFGAEEWNEARQLARERHSEHTAEYLLGMPMLGDHLQEGLTQLGFDCGETERRHL